MASFTLTYTGDIAKFEGFINSRIWFRVLGQEIRKANARAAALVERELDDAIRNYDGVNQKLSPLTEAIKGKSDPLVDTGQLLDAISHEFKSDFKARVGFVKNQPASHGVKMKKLLKIIEEGIEIKITPKMRRWLMAQKGADRTQVDPTRKTQGGVIRIPPRPILEKVFRNEQTEQRIRGYWDQAIARALQRVGAK